MHKSGPHVNTKAVCDDVHSPAVLLPTSLQMFWGFFFISSLINHRWGGVLVTSPRRLLGLWYGSPQHNGSGNSRNWGKKELVRGGFWESALQGGPHSQSRSFVERCSSGKAAIQAANSHISSTITAGRRAVAASLCGLQHTDKISSHNHIIAKNKICFTHTLSTLTPQNTYFYWNKIL